jgi:hypothetical protein
LRPSGGDVVVCVRAQWLNSALCRAAAIRRRRGYNPEGHHYNNNDGSSACEPAT